MYCPPALDTTWLHWTKLGTFISYHLFLLPIGHYPYPIQWLTQLTGWRVGAGTMKCVPTHSLLLLLLSLPLLLLMIRLCSVRAHSSGGDQTNWPPFCTDECKIYLIATHRHTHVLIPVRLTHWLTASPTEPQHRLNMAHPKSKRTAPLPAAAAKPTPALVRVCIVPCIAPGPCRWMALCRLGWRWSGSGAGTNELYLHTSVVHGHTLMLNFMHHFRQMV